MRILQVIPSLAAAYGGPPVAAQQLAKHLATRGHDVSIYTTDADGVGGHLPLGRPGADVQEGYQVCYFRARPPRGYLISYPLLRAIKRSIGAFDVVHVYSVFLFTTLIACSAARIARVPYIVEPHGTFDPFLMRKGRLKKLAYIKLLEHYNLDGAFAVRYTTEEEARLATPFVGPRPRPCVIPLGVDSDVFKPVPELDGIRPGLNIPPARSLVLFYGRINYKKGLDLLVPAFRRVIDSGVDAHLLIVGHDNEGYGQRVRGWVAESQLQDRVSFLPPVDGQDRLRVLQSADLFVLPSYTENFGLAVVEAMSMQKPVVISDQVNIHAGITAANAGIVTRLDVEEVGQAMQRILADRALASRMGANGRALALRCYAWPSVAGEVERLYQRAVSGDAARAAA